MPKKKTKPKPQESKVEKNLKAHAETKAKSFDELEKEELTRFLNYIEAVEQETNRAFPGAEPSYTFAVSNKQMRLLKIVLQGARQFTK